MTRVPRPGAAAATGVWDRLVADSATARRRLDELAGPSRGAPGELAELLARASAAERSAADRVRRAAVANSPKAAGSALELPHDPVTRACYEELAALTRAQRDLTHRAHLLTLPSPESEHRFLLSGLRRAVTELESRVR